MTRLLKAHSRRMCLGLAVLLSCLLGSHLFSEETMPFGDGLNHSARAFTLYGYLHSGQWAQFWNLLATPKQVFLPLHYVIFFGVPQAWAGMTIYAAIQVFTTNLLLGFAVWKLCDVLQRAEWAPSLFLLCATQNFALNYPYLFHVDMPFFAMGILALAWQIGAWREAGKFSASVLSGLGVALLFWIKPGNALVFLATYLVAEGVYGVFVFRAAQKRGELESFGRSLVRHGLGIITGFVPVTVVALLFGAGRAILHVIDGNEVHDIPTTLQCTGLLRFFYFPLCLSYFYHLIILGVLGVCIIGFAFWKRKENSAVTSEKFRWECLLPLVFAYLLLGEVTSFILLVKNMRSLLLVLPVLWLLFFVFAEKGRVQPGALFIAAATYSLIALSQIFSNAVGSFLPIAEDYQLQGPWLSQMPEQWYAFEFGSSLNDEVSDAVRRDLPQGGKIGVSTKHIYVDSKCLFWSLNRGQFLEGQSARYEVDNLFDRNGNYYGKAFIDSNLLLLITHPELQVERVTWQNTLKLFNFGNAQWQEKDQIATLAVMPFSENSPLGYEVLFKQPLTGEQLDTSMKSINCPATATDDPDTAADVIWGHPYTPAEALRLFELWKARRLGDSPPR